MIPLTLLFGYINYMFFTFLGTKYTDHCNEGIVVTEVHRGTHLNGRYAPRLKR